MKERFNLEYLNTFVIAAETGKFNVTAEMVYRSHSSVSMQIKKLEEQINMPLFIRSKDTLTLTKVGETLYSYARQILDLNDSAFNSLNHSDWKGSLTFGVPTDYADFFIRFVYPKLQEEYPDFNLKTICSRSRELRNDIKTNHINAAMVAMEPQYSDDIFLWEEELCWVSSKDFIYEADSYLPIALFSDNCIINNHSLYCLKKTNINFKIVFASTMMDNIASCVKTGAAISLLPKSLITDEFRILPLDFLPCPFTLKIGLTWGENADFAMLDFIKKTIINSL